MTGHKKDIKPLAGNRYGRLLVVEYSHTNESRVTCWRCVCDCGKEITVRRSALISGNTTSCGCYNREVVSLPLGVAATNKVEYFYKSNAMKRGISYDLERSDFLNLIMSNCYYCGTPPSNRLGVGFHGAVDYSGIDRLDSKKGYVLGNVVPCCKKCNFAKRSLTVDEFFAWINSVVNHSKKLLDKFGGRYATLKSEP